MFLGDYNKLINFYSTYSCDSSSKTITGSPLVFYSSSTSTFHNTQNLDKIA